jgi:hypothetical protein
MRRDFFPAVPTFTTSLSSLDRVVRGAGSTVEVMKTLDRLESDYEHLSPHIAKSGRSWWIAGFTVAVVIAVWFVAAAIASAL